jgi:hypothetical protein
MSGRGKVAGSGKARAKAKTRSSKAGLQFPVVCIISVLFHIEEIFEEIKTERFNFSKRLIHFI